MRDQTPWERVLWKDQSYPDNHVPRSFLSSLSKNPNVKPYTYWPLVVGSCAITQHLSSILLFIVAFVYLYNGSLDPRFLVFISAGMFLVGLVLWELLDRIDSGWATHHEHGDYRAKAAKASILVFLALIALAPILRTLTAPTSSDSIWALSICLFILNAGLADYSSVRRGGQVRERLTSVLSMNAAISAAVVLASRLHEDLAVFALVLFAVLLFALFPILRHRLQSRQTNVRLLFTAAMSALALSLMSQLSASATLLFGSVMASVTFVAPAVLVRAQAHKNEIHGPWDVAIPKVYKSDSSRRRL